MMALSLTMPCHDMSIHIQCALSLENNSSCSKFFQKFLPKITMLEPLVVPGNCNGEEPIYQFQNQDFWVAYFVMCSIVWN